MCSTRRGAVHVGECRQPAHTLSKNVRAVWTSNVPSGPNRPQASPLAQLGPQLVVDCNRRNVRAHFSTASGLPGPLPHLPPVHSNDTAGREDLHHHRLHLDTDSEPEGSCGVICRDDDGIPCRAANLVSCPHRREKLETADLGDRPWGSVDWEHYDDYGEARPRMVRSEPRGSLHRRGRCQI